MKLPILAIAAIAITTLTGCGGMTTNASPPATAVTAAAGTAAQGAAGAYCKQTGGEVEHRRPVYGSNSSNLLFLAGEQSFCQYTSKKDGSRIHILLETLYTTKPSLAALAYINKPTVGSCNGNPASCYCSLLGGSDQFGGTTGAGGGWYDKNSIDQTLEACIFPDMSSIDSWGLTYHADGIIRGINLQKVMRYKYPSS
jgi:putative hemolysin